MTPRRAIRTLAAKCGVTPLRLRQRVESRLRSQGADVLEEGLVQLGEARVRVVFRGRPGRDGDQPAQCNQRGNSHS